MSTSRTADFAGFFDDAAIFPPGLAALPDAVRAHLERRATPVEALTGCLLLTIDRLPDAVRIAVEVAGEQGIDLSADPLRVGLVVAPGDIERVMEGTARLPAGIEISGLELKTDDRWPDQLSTGVELASRVPASVHVELSLDAVRRGGVRDLMGTPARLKFRTGGVEAHYFPSADELATVISTAVDLSVPFKLTAGLHRAVRHVGAGTGFPHHGFLNIALATAAAQSGAPVHEVAAALGEDRPETLRVACADTTHNWRTYFESFGTCSINEPVESLTQLGLLDSTFLTPTGGHP